MRGEDPHDAIDLPLYLRDAYARAEDFCNLLGKRVKGSGFLKTLLLRRLGSSIAAGRKTAEAMLRDWEAIDEADEEEDDPASSETRTLTPSERGLLDDFVAVLGAYHDRDPKVGRVLECLRDRDWLGDGCIVFSQYFASIESLSHELTREFPKEPIAIYAGGGRSGIVREGAFRPAPRDEIKRLVTAGEIRLVLGTDAASEGLNLQRLGCLINLDLPWNPTRLEQRKGRIQRIGQTREVVRIYNLRYLGSVEDRVHQLLSDRLANIYGLFGQIPDVLEDVWIDVAIGDIEAAKKRIDAVPKQHAFELRYNRIERVPWESCTQVLDAEGRRRHLMQGWR